MRFSTLYSFTGASGTGADDRGNPYAGVTVDADGNIFGTTTLDTGSVFEIKAGSTTATTLVTFGYTDGAYPYGTVTFDAEGDLFGTTQMGGSGSAGTVFEIEAGTTDTTKLYSFTGDDGAQPYAGVTLDAEGDIFGTTGEGGADGYGTVFEIKAGTSTLTTLYSFAGEDGNYPQGRLALDSAGDIFGTTYFGGSSGQGTVFEIKAGTTTVTTLYSFTGTGGDGAFPQSGVTLDARGDLFGTTIGGGSHRDGTVYEIKAGTTTATTLVSFNGADGFSPVAGVTLDAAGDLFGTTAYGGSAGNGTVFEIKAGTTTLTTLHSFTDTGTDGSEPFGSVTLAANGDLIGTTVGGGLDGDGTVFELTPPCYRAGTLIRTDRGQVAVEALAVGDIVPTVLGGRQPVRWIGHRRIDCRRHPRPEDVWPVRVSAGAFGDRMPLRDLWLSPDHAVFVEDGLIPIKHLINDRSIAQVQVDTVTYYHIELPAHDVLLAEGLPCESYLDTGNRTAFINGGAFVEAHADFAPRHWTETCRPMVFDGPVMDRTLELIFARAKVLGASVTSESGVHLIADGQRIEPVLIGANRILFVLPMGCGDISLRSRCFVPAHTRPPNKDGRSLGLCIGRLVINDRTIPLEDDALNEGWHKFEQSRRQAHQRWTKGITPLPSGARRILIDLAGPGYYWQDSQQSFFAQTRSHRQARQ